MSAWPSAPARRVLRALLRIGRVVSAEWAAPTSFSLVPDIGPKMLARISKHTGLEPQDL